MTLPLLTDARARHLAQAAQGLALQCIVFDRDESDSFRVQIESMGAVESRLSRSAVMRAFPVGSRWIDAIGWESYVVFPADLVDQTRNLAVVGLEYVVPHITRGAHPAFVGVVVKQSDVGTLLQRLALKLDPETATSVPSTYGIVAARSRSPDEHRATAAWILRAAATSFERGHPQLVRTALLTADEVPTSGMVLHSRSVLLCTISHLRSKFSLGAKLVLTLLRAPLPGTDVDGQ